MSYTYRLPAPATNLEAKPLYQAVASGNLAGARKLLKEGKVPPDITRHVDQQALDDADGSTLSSIKLGIFPLSGECTALQDAIVNTDAAMVKVLLKAGADPSRPFSYYGIFGLNRSTPIHVVACMGQELAFSENKDQGRVKLREIIRILLIIFSVY